MSEYPMRLWETFVWLVVTVTGFTLVQWIDGGGWLYAIGVGYAVATTAWVSILNPPLRWWVAAMIGADLLWQRVDMVAAKFGMVMQRLPDLNDQEDWVIWCWFGSGFVAGWLYSRVRGWSLHIDAEDFPAATHCLFWGAFVGPVLLVGVFYYWRPNKGAREPMVQAGTFPTDPLARRRPY